MTEPGTSDQDELASAISDEVHRIHRDSYGYGATDVETYLLDEHILTVLDGIELSPGEKVLISAGRQELVREVRRQFQLSIKPTFTAAIPSTAPWTASSKRVFGTSKRVVIAHP